MVHQDDASFVISYDCPKDEIHLILTFVGFVFCFVLWDRITFSSPSLQLHVAQAVLLQQSSSFGFLSAETIGVGSVLEFEKTKYLSNGHCGICL